MKTLLLLRHAKSSWKEPGMDDHDRPLNDRGKRDAPKVGELILAQNLKPDRIVSSTAKRAKKTAEKVAVSCGYVDDVEFTRDLYLASLAGFRKVIRNIDDDCERLLLVGHNPGLEILLTAITGDEELLPTAALAEIELAVGKWSDFDSKASGRLAHIWRPKELAGQEET
jgi:phosphohistidine phosphatase